MFASRIDHRRLDIELKANSCSLHGSNCEPDASKAPPARRHKSPARHQRAAEILVALIFQNVWPNAHCLYAEGSQVNRRSRTEREGEPGVVLRNTHGGASMCRPGTVNFPQR